MSTLGEVIGGRIRAAREKKELNQSKLAGKIKLTASSINQYESGAKMPSVEMLLKLSAVLETSCDYLLGGTKISEYFMDKETAAAFLEFNELVPRDRRVVLNVIKSLKEVQ